MPNERLLLLNLLGVFTICCVVQITEQGGIFGAPGALYLPTDHVVILNATSIKPTIYGTTNGWIVEFFSSWCGHCINFAPVYKQFAAETEAWKNVVRIAGIDCADEANIPTCREYEIMGYPTILYFPPKSEPTKTVEGKAELNRGLPFPRSEKVSQLKQDLMETVSKNFPGILGEVNTSLSTFTSVWKYAKKESLANGAGKPLSLVIMLFEKEKSFIGKELALRLSIFPEVRVLRFNRKNNLYDRLGLKDEWPAAGYLKPDRRFGGIPIPKNRDIVAVLQSAAIKKLKEEGSRPLSPSKAASNDNQLQAAEEMEEQIADEKEEEVKVENSNIEEPASGTVSGDVVSLEDIIHAVRNSLRNEVGMFKIIEGDKLKVLKEYVHVLGQLFPADRREMIVFLMKLDEWLESQGHSVKVNEYLDKMTELELELHPWDININTWGSCKGTVPGRRGYTCGLWRLFHSLTLLATQKSQEIFVLPVIYGYVKEFFGCSECVSHFTKMVHDEGALMVSTVRTQALWLWRAHNKVNIRLKGSLSEDPGFPKELYPSDKHCSDCHNAEGSFEEEKVFEYLLKVYTNPQRTMPNSPEVIHGQSNHRKESFSERSTRSTRPAIKFFSGADYWLFFLVYFSVAGLLIFGYVHFKYGSRRRLDPLAICRKFLHSSKSIV